MMFARRYAGWPAFATELVERACERHGGWTRFERVNAVTLSVVTLGGPLPALKGAGRTFPLPGALRVEPHAQKTTFMRWPSPGEEGRFDRGRVLVTRHGEASVRAAPDHRSRMPKLRWRPEDALYFFGYALANYLSLPFLLAQTRFVRMHSRGVVVDFPEGLHAHSTRQAFEFDESGLLVRHDYTADVVGPWATGSHYSSDYTEIDGMPFARSRRVVARLGQWVTPLPVLNARLDQFVLEG